MFAFVGGVKGLVSPPALLAGALFISRPAESRPAALAPALDLCVVPAPRSPNPDAFVTLPACTAATWFCCIDCRSCVACSWNVAGRAVLCVPKKRCAPPLRMVEAAGSPSTRRQTGVRGHHWQIPGHHASASQLFARSCHGTHPASSEVSGTYCRQSSSNVRIVDVRHVREPSPPVQRREAAVAIEPATPDHAEAAAISAPPGMGNSRTDQSAASRTRPSPDQSPNPIHRTTHKPAPRTDGRSRRPIPVPATTPTRRHTTSSARSDKAPSPTARNPPRSTRSPVPKPSFRRDTAPNRPARSEPRPHRSPERSPTCRWRPDPPTPCSNGWCASRPARPGSCGRDRCSNDPSHPHTGAAEILYCASSTLPRTVAISPWRTCAMPFGVEICASPLRTITSVSPSGRTSMRNTPS